jgi:amino acid adenylation domain-containing protein
VYIRQLIETRLNGNDFKFFDCQKQLVSMEKVRKEYNAIKNYLLDHHSSEKDCLAIKLTKDYRYLLTMLACMEIGIPYIPMKSDYPENRIEQIKEDSKFTLLVTDQNIEILVSYSQQSIIKLSEISPERAMYIIFTSGSTGRPKGVIIQRKAATNFFQWMDAYFPNVTKQDRLLQVTEFTFDISLVDVGLFLLKNVEVYFTSFENNIFKLGFEIETHKITALNTVPNNLNMFLSDMVADRMDYKSLKHLFIAGSRFSFGLYQKCQKYFTPDVNLYNLYGPTECTVYSHGKKISFHDQDDCSEHNVSIGQPLTNLFSVIVQDGEVVKPHERGELYLGGVQLLKEYINNPEQTKTAIVEFQGKRFYKTGDLAFMDEKGDYYIVGRNDDTIKYRGFRINLLDVDSYILKVPYVQDCATIAIENESGENQTVAFMILKEIKTVKEIKKDLALVLLDFQIPEKIIFVESYPTNISGKVDRKALKANYLVSSKKA